MSLMKNKLNQKFFDMTTDIAVILDKSGSMNQVKEDSIGGFNQFLEEQKGIIGNAFFTLTLFNHSVDIVESRIPLTQAEKLDEDTYTPEGMTALHDAICYTIDELGNKLDKLNKENKPDKVVVAIITDGLENSSKEFAASDVKEKISHQRENYSWEFLFLSASEEDATEEGTGYGIKARNTMNYANTRQGTQHAYKSVTQSVNSVRTGKETDLKDKEEESEEL